MGEYEDIMTLIENEHETFLGTATQYVPRLRKALENAKPDITKEEIKERIKADCKKYWTTETIMNALGDDFKNKVFVNAGKKKAQTQNTPSNDSRVSDKEIIIDTSGKPITEDPDSENLSIQNAKEKLNKIYPDIDEDEEDIQIKLNDLQVQLDQTTTKLSNSERNWIKKEKELTDKIAELEQLHKSNPNFKPASEIKTKDEEDSIPYSQHRQVVGNLNSRILELKEKLSSAEKKEHRLEFGDKIIVIVTEAIGLKSITIDEAKTRRLNQ